jgi:integrase
MVCNDVMKHALKKHRTWYAALTVPADVRDIIGKVRFFQSTKTESAALAANRVALLVARWQAEIAKARGTLPNQRDDFWLTLRKQYEGTSDEATMMAIEDVAEAAAKKAGDPSLYMIATAQAPAPTALNPLVAEWKAALKLAPKTADQQHRDVLRMAEHFQYVEKLKPQAVKAWTDGLIVQKMTADSLERIMSGCRSLWRYMQDLHTVPMDAPDPFVGAFRLAKKKADRNKVAREAFTAKDLAKVYAKAAKGDPALAQVIALGAYTGCRIEELFELKVEHCASGTFNIIDAKTDAGIRKVPIHPKLSKMVSTMKKASTDGFLIPSTAAGQYGVRSDPASKRFGRLKTAMGFGPEHVYHSIRKTVATLLEQAAVPEGIAADILGHEKKTMSYGLYSAGSSHSQKLEALAKVGYPGALATP